MKLSLNTRLQIPIIREEIEIANYFKQKVIKLEDGSCLGPIQNQRTHSLHPVCHVSAELRDAPFDFWGGGDARLLLSVMFFFFEKLAHNFFFSTDLETNILFVPGKKIKHFFCDSSYLIKYVDNYHALTLMKVSL